MSDLRQTNLERAARYPWLDDGRCAVREAANPWAVLVERCYDSLDRSRLRFEDAGHVCPVAQAGVVASDDVMRMVGICLLIQPEVALAAVVVVGAVVVAAAIAAEIEAAQRTKPGCRCLCLSAGAGPVSEYGRVASAAECALLCRNHPNGPLGSVCQ